MLHIYILTFISEESKALYTVNTWPGLASCHLETQGKWIKGACASSNDNAVHWDQGHEGQFYNNLIFSRYILYLIPMGESVYIIYLAYAKTDFQTMK